MRIIGVVKPHKAEYVIRNLLGDASAPINESQANILERLSRYVELGEDIICDLRENNGAIPKYDDVWGIVDHVIKTKIGVDDRRHSVVSEDGEVVVNIAMAPSLAHIYRECEHLAKEKEPAVSVAARPAANHSFRNPVERCHCIANIGLQAVGMMRSRQDSDFESLMARCDGNSDFQKK